MAGRKFNMWLSRAIWGSGWAMYCPRCWLADWLASHPTYTSAGNSVTTLLWRAISVVPYRIYGSGTLFAKYRSTGAEVGLNGRYCSAGWKTVVGSCIGLFLCHWLTSVSYTRIFAFKPASCMTILEYSHAWLRKTTSRLPTIRAKQVPVSK